jgi:hypothetical protein
MMSGRTSIVLKRLVAGIALYGLILHTSLSTVHFYANLNPAGSLHGLAEICFGLGAGDRADNAPSDQKAADYSCRMCVRLAGLHLAPPPAAMAAPLVFSRPIEVASEAFEHHPSPHFVRPHTRGPPSFSV